tara:strand:- start:217 stop:531 length:315 start_codon:yes stop_codon:yes gene_type:complete
VIQVCGLKLVIKTVQIVLLGSTNHRKQRHRALRVLQGDILVLLVLTRQMPASIVNQVIIRQLSERVPTTHAGNVRLESSAIFQEPRLLLFVLTALLEVTRHLHQ